MKINKILAREILDSRGNPTVEVDVILENGLIGRAAVPSGASTGSHEAHELRDGEASRFGGKGVTLAKNNVDTEINNALQGFDVTNQQLIDDTLLKLDGTENKKRLGANAILGVSMAVAKAAANVNNLSLHQYLHKLAQINDEPVLPLPMCNIINGGAHAAGSTDIQEFMVMPIGAPNYAEAVRMLAEIFASLKKVLSAEGYGTTVGDEGGFAPAVKKGNAEALDLVMLAIDKAGYKAGVDVALALDVAATELYADGYYELKCENKKLSSEEMIDWYAELCTKYPIVSIEDGLAENDWEGWQKLTARIGDKVQLVGDDLLVTNPKFLARAIAEKSCNAILVKVNQIGSLTETIEAIKMAKEAGFGVIVSHRSGETEDVTIAHIAVGLAAGQIKTGSVSRGERTAKYNEITRIAEELPAAQLYKLKK